MAKYTVAVRTLCEFAAKQGDLDLRFNPSPTAQDGIKGHSTVIARRGAGYRAKVPLSGEYADLVVRGRADGVDAGRARLEEIKTHRGAPDRVPANHRHLHWAQAKVYAWLWSQQAALPALDVCLVYFDIDSLEETVLVERCTAAQLRLHFERLCLVFRSWAEQETAHRETRDQALEALGFPHAGFRTGQRELAASVYRAARARRCLLAQAPTGIGKTMGTLFPMLKAMPASRLDRVFFLTAKTSGRAVALRAMAVLRGSAATLPLRVLELVSRQKSCEHPGKACQGEACPLARGFYDRLPAARQSALAIPDWDGASVRAVALHCGICPYWMRQELARWSDVVVGDYNHFFDSGAMLHGLTVECGWKVGVLIDEAHNLVGRARQMYSAMLELPALEHLCSIAPSVLKRSLTRVLVLWHALERDQSADYRVLDEPPKALLAALKTCIVAITDYLVERPAPVDSNLQSFFFDAMRFVRLADEFGSHSMVDSAAMAGLTHALTPGARRLCLRNIVPAPFLKSRFDATATTTLFSATLAPPHYYREMLGLPVATDAIDVDSPFKAKQMVVRISDVSTGWEQRTASAGEIVDCMARQFQFRPGNYLAFFSSYAYMQQIARGFVESHPDIPVRCQSTGMSETEQAQYLQQFEARGRCIGFAVLGGAFSESIDLPGDRLIGAFIATLGMPQIGGANEEMRRRLDKRGSNGFDYIYLYPGLQKVIQAAGRVIRSTSDVGFLHLLDHRYLQPRVRRLLPRWWAIETTSNRVRQPAER